MSQWKVSILGLGMAFFAAACGGGNGDGDSGAETEAGPVTLIAFDRAGDLFVIDPSDGSSTLKIDTFYDGGAGPVDIGRVSSCIYNPVTGKIWMGTGGDRSPCGGCLLALDTGTGEGVLVADNDPPMNAFPGMAMGAGDRVLVPEADQTGMFELNNITGAPVKVSDTTAGVSGNGMTFSNSGVLYLAADEKVYSVDVTTFDATELADLTKSGFPTDERGEIICLTTRPSDGAIFGIFKDGAGIGGGGAIYLLTLDPVTGVATYVGTMAADFEGLAFVPTSSIP